MGVSSHEWLGCPLCKEKRYDREALAIHIAYGHNWIFEGKCPCGYRLQHHSWTAHFFYNHLRVQDDIIEHLLVAQTMNAIAGIGQ